MRIDAIKLQNYRGFDAFQRSFSPNINVIIGDNGAGKTALLDALAIGAGSFFLGVDGHSPRPIKTDDVRLVVRDVKGTFNAAQQFPVSLSFDGAVFAEPIGWTRTLTGSKHKTTFAGASTMAGAVAPRIEATRKGADETLPLIAYHGTGRLWKQKKTWKATRAKRARSRLEGYASCLEAESDEKGFAEWLKTAEWIEFQEGKPPLGLIAVKDAIGGMVPGCTDIRYRAKEGEIVATFGERRLPMRLLSDGFRTMLGLVADLAWRAATLNPHLGERASAETPGVVLIDEVDLHLHPNWQRRVVDDLRRVFPLVQFFLTTHSPFIVQSLKAGEVVPLSEPTHLEKPPYRRGIEEVAADVMGVEGAERSQRFVEMERAAQELVALLDREGAKADAIERARARYLDLVSRYSDDPAYLASLKVEGAFRGVRLDGTGAAR